MPNTYDSLTDEHKSAKKDSYWENLVAGDTAIYKAKVIDHLISEHMPDKLDAVLDIGCGTSEIAVSHANMLSASRVVCLDYDAEIIKAAQKSLRVVNDDTEWVVDDIFALGSWSEKFDLIFLLDMVHEVYSFCGRSDPKIHGPILHEKGLVAVRDGLTQVGLIVKPGGGIVISDNVLCPENNKLQVQVKSEKIKETVGSFLDGYVSRNIDVRWLDENRFEILAHDFCIMLTQYNKIKNGQLDRWNVERFEIHQYFTKKEYLEFFVKLGFTLHIVVGTPEQQRAEWNCDFMVVDGMDSLPEKRITLLAVKN